MLILEFLIPCDHAMQNKWIVSSVMMAGVPSWFVAGVFKCPYRLLYVGWHSFPRQLSVCGIHLWKTQEQEKWAIQFWAQRNLLDWLKVALHEWRCPETFFRMWWYPCLLECFCEWSHCHQPMHSWASPKVFTEHKTSYAVTNSIHCAPGIRMEHRHLSQTNSLWFVSEECFPQLETPGEFSHCGFPGPTWTE